MKKFTFKGVLDGFRSSVSQSGPNPTTKNEQELSENLKPENFNVTKTFCHGFPYQPTAIAYDPIQRLLVIGTKTGCLRMLGRPGVDLWSRHDPETGAVTHLLFVWNEGNLISVTADDSLHLWNFRSKKPLIVQSLKFQRERITCLQLSFQSKWLCVGTERGNVHIVNTDTFQLSGYIINWNKAIELSRKTHPGPVVYLGDNPIDPNKLLIGFETGQLVMWDLKNKCAEMRFQASEPLRSLSWHSDGKQFMSAHADGSLVTWNIRQGAKPVSITWPHSRTTKEGKTEPCKSIQKVEWKSSRTGENFVIFSGGLTVDRAGRTPSLTVIHGKTTTVLEMEHNVLDFVVLSSAPWESEVQDPYAIIILLQEDLVVIDLLTPGYPCFENPYPMDIHESPVTSCVYLADCPGDLIPAFYSVGSKTQKKSGFSERDWPINGGQWGSTSCSYAEIIVSGHADGSLKFWDASSTNLQALYKLKTSKPFERPKKARSTESMDDDPFAVQQITICPESRYLAVAGASSQILLFKFKKHEHTSETAVIEIPILYDMDEVVGGSGFDFVKVGEVTTGKQADWTCPIKPKSGMQRKSPGYQVELICLTPWVDGESPGAITTVAVNSCYGLMAYGNETGIVVVDILQKVALFNVGTPDLYGAADPYQRAPKSPKKPDISDEKSPTEQMDGNGFSRGSVSSGGGTSPSRKGGSTAPPPVGSGGSQEPGAVTQPPTSSQLAVVRRSKSQGSQRTNRRLSKCYSMAQGSLGSEEGDSVPSSPAGLTVTAAPPPPSHAPPPSGPSKSHLLLLSRQYYSFGSNVTHQATPNYQPDKLDPSFARSRSSSMSSLDNISSEAIQCLAFIDCMSRRNDYSVFPTLWAGTSLGSILVISIKLPTAGDARKSEPVVVTPSGTIFRLKGSILAMSFLDCNGILIPGSNEPWKDESREPKAKTPTKSLSGQSPTQSLDAEKQDRQFAVLVSEKQSRVVALPSQTCIYKQELCETAFVVKANVTTIKDSVCLVCYLSNGHLTVYSLPSLKLLIDVDFVPLSDLSFQRSKKSGVVDPMLSIWGQQLFVNEDANQIAKTFCLSAYGHGVYLSSPSEIQKFTASADFCQIMDSMLGELFLETEMPERPKESFLTGLFGGGVRNLDREELFGETFSGKGAQSVAKVIPRQGAQAQMDHLGMRSSTAASEIAKTRLMLVERGDKLGQLEDRTAKMSSDAENFSSAAHQLMLKYKDKKWYQL